MPLDYVRVVDLDTGHAMSVPEPEVNNGRYRVLEGEPAVNVNGDPLPGQLNYTDPEPAADEPTDPDGAPAYDGWRNSALEDEIGRRNAGRDDEHQIVVEAPGNKPQLVDALQADDANETQEV